MVTWFFRVSLVVWIAGLLVIVQDDGNQHRSLFFDLLNDPQLFGRPAVNPAIAEISGCADSCRVQALGGVFTVLHFPDEIGLCAIWVFVAVEVFLPFDFLQVFHTWGVYGEFIGMSSLCKKYAWSQISFFERIF